jgi:hypothetical protein
MSSSSSSSTNTPQRNAGVRSTRMRVRISDKVLLYLNNRALVPIENTDLYDERLKHTLEAINRRGTSLAVNRPSIAALQLYLLQDPTVYDKEPRGDNDVRPHLPVLGPIDTLAKADKLTYDLYLASLALEEDYFYQHNATHALQENYPRFFRIFEEACLLRTRLTGLTKGRALTFYKLLELYTWIVQQPSAPNDLHTRLRDVERELARRENELPNSVDPYKTAVKQALLIADELLSTGLSGIRERVPKPVAPQPVGPPMITVKIEPQEAPAAQFEPEVEPEEPPPPIERPKTPVFANPEDVNDDEGDQYEDE